jgi:phospholipid/cholesterol/gamma-HCH transport system permease protein
MISALGSSVLGGLGRIGYATRMFLRLVLDFFPLLRRPRLVVKQVHFVGNYSLVIICVSGLFVGFVLGLQGYYTLNR